MGLNCKIVYRDGQALALNDNGQISPLYLEALELYKDEKRALNVWAVSQSEDFQDAFGITPEEAILTDVVTYLDTKSFVDKTMSSSDKIQVKAFMVKNGIESLSDLNSTLSSIFKSKGYFQFDEQKMVDSGLWKASELPYAKTQRKEIQALLSRIEGELITSDITVVAEDNTNQYRDSANKTIFGTSEIIDATEISRAIKKLITNFQDSEEFYAKIKELPFEEFVEKFYTNDKFAEELINRYKQIKKVPVLSFVNGELSADNNETYTTLKNTLLSNINSVSVEADLSYLLSISPEIWNTSQRAIKDILKEVEQEVAKINVDVVGLSNYSNQQENIIDLLSSLNRMVQSPTENNIQEFAQKKDNLIAPEDNTFITETLPENLMNLNIVRLDSNRTDNELFAEHGLIKIGDNLYHKVRRGQITELYDYLYNQVFDGVIDIPTKTQDKTDKPAILKEIAEFVNARNTGIVSEFQEEISLNQLAFGHDPSLNERNTFKTTIVERLTSFNERISNKDFPSVLEVAEVVLPNDVFFKYKNLYELAAKLTIPVNVGNNILPPGMNAAYGQGSINFSPYTSKNTLNTYEEFAETLNHEIVHGLLREGIKSNFKFHTELKYIFEVVRNNFDKANNEVKQIIAYIIDTSNEFELQDYKTEEYTKDLEELVTYAFTNKAFAEFLDSIQSTRANVSGKNSIFNQLKDLIRKAINSLTTNKTVLDDINDTLNSFFNVDFRVGNIAERNEQFGWDKRFETNLKERGITKENIQKDISQLPIITTNTDYLKTEFISDFYNYILEEKLKNSELYRDVLSHFIINDRDISLQGTKTPNIEGIKYEIELRDYARLKRDNSLKAFVESFSMGVSQDLYALNFPEKLPTYRGEIVTDGDFAILNKTILDIVKFNNKVYRKVGENFKVSVYQEIKTKPDTVYYTTNLNFTTDREAVEKVMERYPEGLSVQELTYEQKQENLKKARMTESVPHAKYQIISEGNKLTGNDKVSFDSAKEMETKGKSREEIFKETRWFKVKGNQWRREIGDLKLNKLSKEREDELVNKLLEDKDITVKLNELFDITEINDNIDLENATITLKYGVDGTGVLEGMARSRQGIFGADLWIKGGGYTAIRRAISGGAMGGSFTNVRRDIQTVINHEAQHYLQYKSGRKVGNSVDAIANFYFRKNINLMKGINTNEGVYKKLSEIYGVEDFRKEVAEKIYFNSIGEREAREVETRIYDKSKAPSMFEDAILYDLSDFNNGTVVTDELGMSYKDVTTTDLKFTQNLVEFIRQKGVQVITDPEQMKAELEGAMPMIVGERGARELDQLEDATNRIDNLVIARKMEVSGKSPLEIKRATLWERGSDKKWRFETLDGELKINEIQHDQEYTISDLFEESDMTKLYGDIKVIFTNEGYNNNITARAIDNDGTMSITFNTHTIPSQNTYTKRTTTDIRNNWRNARGMVRDTLIHEGQHAVQKEAGFELGGNSFTAIKRAIEIIDGTPQDVESQLRIKAENYLRNNDRQQYGRLVEGLLEYLSTPKEFRQVVLDKLYERLSGETEARNAEERANMTLEEKRNKLLSETQDVATEDQLFLADAITPSEFYKYYNINYLQTPAGNVLGFEKNGIIYLDETQLNNVTTIHELKHVYDVITDIKAAQGDEIAQKIIAKREELFNDEAEAAIQFHEGVVGEGEVNPMIIGEKGAKEMVEINQLLDVAKKMDAVGIHPTQIEKTTGWFKEFDQWRYFSKEALETFNIQNEAYNKLDTEQNLEDVIGIDNILFTFYPQLKQTKVVFYEGREDILGSEQGERIMVNTRRSTDTINGGEYLGGLAGAERGITREESIILTLAHETSHRIQTLEGTLRGGSTETIIREAQRITGEQRPQLGFLRDSIEKTIESTENNEELFILENALIVVNSRLVEDESNALKVYKSLYGEAEARSLEYAKSELTKGRDLSDVTFTELREKLLEAENLTVEGLIPIRGEGENKSQLKDTIGLDLSSPLYSQRPNESRQEWKTRLLKEVEAYVTAPEIAKKLENLRKENPSLWQQITDYINMLTNWLKDQIGLTDYKGDIMDMTKEEYVNALGVSILKDEYTVLPTYQQLQDKYNSIAPFKNGEIEIIYHHTEAQHEEIMNKIDECGS